MIRYGKISEIDASKGRARVNFEEDGIVSDWLPISLPSTTGIKFEFWPTVNMFVWCAMDENSEEGVVGGAIYDDGNTPPIGNKDVSSITFADGTKITYDASSSEMTIDCTGDVTIKCVNATIEASTKVIVDCPTSEFTGDVNVQGGISATGNVESTGSIKASGQVEALSGTPAVVRLSTHNHPTAAPGPVSPPTPGT